MTNCVCGDQQHLFTPDCWKANQHFYDPPDLFYPNRSPAPQLLSEQKTGKHGEVRLTMSKRKKATSTFYRRAPGSFYFGHMSVEEVTLITTSFNCHGFFL